MPRRWAIASTVAWVDQAENGATLLDLRYPETAVPFKVEDSAAFLWRLIAANPSNNEECARALHEATGRPLSEITQETDVFLRDLAAAGLTEPCDA